MRRRSIYFLWQRQGRWDLLRFILGLLVGAAAAMVSAVSLTGGLSLFGADLADAVFEFINSDIDTMATDPAVNAVVLVAVGVTFWAAAIAGSLIQGRPVISLLKPLDNFRWSIVGKVAAAQLLLFLLSSAVTLPFAEGLRFTGFSVEKLIWLVPMALLILVQTSGEDAFFKGHLLRQIGAIVPIWWVAPVILSLIFTALHLPNPDVQAQLWVTVPFFIISELFIMYLVMRTGGMEAALVLHWFNNFFIFVVLADATTQANDLTLFVFDGPEATSSDQVINVIAVFAVIAIQFVAFTVKKSPFFLPPHGLEAPSETEFTEPPPGMQPPAPPSPQPPAPPSVQPPNINPSI